MSRLQFAGHIIYIVCFILPVSNGVDHISKNFNVDIPEHVFDIFHKKKHLPRALGPDGAQSCVDEWRDLPNRIPALLSGNERSSQHPYSTFGEDMKVLDFLSDPSASDI